jgi:hypothetical protein
MVMRGRSPRTPSIFTTAGWRKFLSLRFWEYKTFTPNNLLAAQLENKIKINFKIIHKILPTTQK